MKTSSKDLLPLTLLSALVLAACILFKQQLAAWHIDFRVVVGANLLLYFISAITFRMMLRALERKNANAFQASVMGGTMIKLFVLGAAALIYLFVAKSNRSINAVFVSMGLYVVYTVLDTRIALKANRENGRN
jgi:hypothetical protein